MSRAPGANTSACLPVVSCRPASQSTVGLPASDCLLRQLPARRPVTAAACLPTNDGWPVRANGRRRQQLQGLLLQTARGSSICSSSQLLAAAACRSRDSRCSSCELACTILQELRYRMPFLNGSKLSAGSAWGIPNFAALSPGKQNTNAILWPASVQATT